MSNAFFERYLYTPQIDIVRLCREYEPGELTAMAALIICTKLLPFLVFFCVDSVYMM